MERRYIKYSINNKSGYDFNDLRRRFFELTGFVLPVKTSKNTDDTHYLSGELKTHFIPEIESTLKLEFPDIEISDGWPLVKDWVRKEYSELG